MLACVIIQVNQIGGSLDGAEGSLFHRFRWTRKRKHCAVVIEVRGAVKQARAFDGGDGGGDLVYYFGSPRFGKVRDTFD